MIPAMGSLEAFQAQRPLLFSIAYRMLGSAAEAEDVLQEAWLRWQEAAPEALDSDKAWLSTVVTRLCLDQLKSARARREAYVGPWLPEPVQLDEPVDPESISLAFLVLLERLTPVERAVYLLREVFDYRFAEIAAIVGQSEVNCRQLHHRARAHVQAARPRFAPSRADHERLLTSFAQAVALGDLEGIKQLLAADATLYTDGGGKVQAARKPIHGADAVGRFCLGVAKKAAAGQIYELREVNGLPSLVGIVDGKVNVVLHIETDGTRIYAVYTVVNPEKLARV